MKNDKAKIFVDSFLANLSEKDREEFINLGFKDEFEKVLTKDLKKIDEPIDDFMLEKMGQFLATNISQDNEDESFSYFDEEMEDTNNYVIKVVDDVKSYSLHELLSSCNKKQLELYKICYKKMFKIVVSATDKNDLVNELEKNIINTFEKIIPSLTKEDIKNFKQAVNNRGYLKDFDDAYIRLGYIFPIKYKNKKLKYVIPKELLELVKKHNFDKISKETIDYCTELLKTLAIMKGVINAKEANEFLIDEMDMNIKSNHIKNILQSNFKKKDKYYYLKDTIDIDTVEELIDAKDDFNFITANDVIEYESLLNRLFFTLDMLSNVDTDFKKYLKLLFYKPVDIDELVNTLSKELKIKTKDKDILKYFLEENMCDFRYWIYNGDIDEEYELEFNPYELGNDPFADFK